MDGYSSWGLVHFTQISDYLSFAKDEHEDEKIATLEEIAPVGQRVWVKIVEISQQDPGQRAKVSCSMKLVNQRDGVDLDPGHAKYKARGEGGVYMVMFFIYTHTHTHVLSCTPTTALF